MVSRSVALWAPATAVVFLTSGLPMGDGESSEKCDFILASRLSPREEAPGSRSSAPPCSHPHPSIFSFPARCSRATGSHCFQTALLGSLGPEASQRFLLLQGFFFLLKTRAHPVVCNPFQAIYVLHELVQ